MSSRGDIRAGVLALLAEQPRHGYEIITELAERSGGVWRPSPGSIYPTLKHLHHEGLVTAEKSEGRRGGSTQKGRDARSGERACRGELARNRR